MKTINLKVTDIYKSIPSGFTWNNIPPFSIITGVNGAGKTQLLEILKGTDTNGMPLNVSAEITDEKVLNKSIAKFIYDTRCAIVHNKEVEIHITYFNYDEYSAIIPLMKKVINGISKRIITLINTSESEITFTKDHLELY